MNYNDGGKCKGVGSGGIRRSLEIRM